jgi:hypothetical protein
VEIRVKVVPEGSQHCLQGDLWLQDGLLWGDKVSLYPQNVEHPLCEPAHCHRRLRATGHCG